MASPTGATATGYPDSSIGGGPRFWRAAWWCSGGTHPANANPDTSLDRTCGTLSRERPEGEAWENLAPHAPALCGYSLAEKATDLEMRRTSSDTEIPSTRRTTLALPGIGSKGCGVCK